MAGVGPGGVDGPFTGTEKALRAPPDGMLGWTIMNPMHFPSVNESDLPPPAMERNLAEHAYHCHGAPVLRRCRRCGSQCRMSRPLHGRLCRWLSRLLGRGLPVRGRRRHLQHRHSCHRSPPRLWGCHHRCHPAHRPGRGVTRLRCCRHPPTGNLFIAASGSLSAAASPSTPSPPDPSRQPLCSSPTPGSPSATLHARGSPRWASSFDLMLDQRKPHMGIGERTPF